MSGYCGSGRWRPEDTRLTTDEALNLDSRYLAREGLLVPGVHAVHWNRGDVPAGSVAIRVGASPPNSVVLVYSIESGNQAVRQVVEHVPLTRTRCHYGGSRVWFSCPGCHRRRAILYGVEGLFRCRVCHDLAYTSTRETAMYRMIRRAQAVQRKLGSVRDGSVYLPPPRPKGMHGCNYRRLCNILEACQIRAIAAGFQQLRM